MNEARKELPSKMECGVCEIRMVVLQRLLGRVLDVVATALPNKQQHDAAVRSVRTEFDKAYFDVLRQTDPDGEFGATEGGWALEAVR